MTVGLLGLQGAFLDHRKHLARLGRTWQIVRDRDDLATVDRLIIPGGESTVMAMFLNAFGLTAPLKQRIAAGMPVWGICAGAILLADTVDGAPGVLRVLAAGAQRNAYGRQDASDIRPLAVPALDRPAFPAIFIRAPKLIDIQPAVSVLAVRGDQPVFVRQEHIMATTFHPELTDDPAFHESFLKL